MSRRRARFALGSLAGGAAACLATAMVLAGCPNTAVTTFYTPPTGIQIDSQELVAGVGCGSAPGQVYRYAAILTQVTKSGMPFVTSGVFGCFTDALFTNLPSPDGGPTDYGVAIYAYDRASFPSELGGCEYVPSGMACPGDDASVVRRYESQATWTTSCTATQYQGVPQVALCAQLMPADAGTGGDASEMGDVAADASDAVASGDAADSAETATVEASDGPGVSGEGGDAPLE